MALDWKKEVNLSSITGLIKRKGAASAGSSSYPSKTTMNLYQGEKSNTDVRKVVVVGVLLAVLIGLFVKFGVLDLLAQVSQKEGELASQQAIAMSLTSAGKDFDETKELYDAYTAQYGSASTDAIAVLDMVEQHVMNASTVTSIVLADNTLTLTLYNVPLDTVGNLAKDLETQPMVTRVNVSTATTQKAEGQNTVSTLVITLVNTGSEEK